MTARVLFDPLHIPQLDSHPLAGQNCVAAGSAVADCRNNLSNEHPLTPGQVRDATGDTSGGLSIQQGDDALLKLDPPDRLSTGYYSQDQVERAIREGGQAWLGAFRYRRIMEAGRRQRKAGVPDSLQVAGSETFGSDADDWHAIVVHCWLNAGESRVLPAVDAKGVRYTKEVVGPGWVGYDSLCDHRRKGLARGPVVYTQELFDALCSDSLYWRGKLYGALTMAGWLPVVVVPPKPEPQPKPPKPKPPTVVLKYGGQETNRATRRVVAPSYFRASPFKSKKDPKRNVVAHAPRGLVFRNAQTTNQGTLIAGSRRWFGNATGDRWIHESRTKVVA